MEQKKFARKGIFSNPVTKKLRKAEWTADGEVATYRGITVKALLLVLTVIVGGALARTITDDGTAITLGIVSCIVMLLSPIFVNISVKIAPFASVIGALAMGYAAGFAGYMLPEYSNVIFLAATLTVAVVLSMMVVYFSGIVKVTGKFKRVLYSLLFASVIGSLLLLALGLIPATKGITLLFINNPVICLTFSVLGVVLAALFLLSDFDDIANVVASGAPAAYEWNLSYSIVITIVWLYLEIFDLIMTIRDIID